MCSNTQDKKPTSSAPNLADPHPQLHILMPVDYTIELRKTDTGTAHDVTMLYSEYE